MYKLKTDAEGRIVEALYCTERDGICIDEFPGSPIDDYKYINGKVIYDPIPNRPVHDPTAPTQMDVVEAQVSYTAMMTDTILEV